VVRNFRWFLRLFAGDEVDRELGAIFKVIFGVWGMSKS